MIKRLAIIAILGILFISCASREKLVYYQNIKNLPSSEMTNYNPTLKEDDLLLILVSAPIPETAKDFNLTTYNMTGGTGLGAQNLDIAQGQIRHQTYLIDNKGFIQFPVIGSIKLGGLTREEALRVLNTSLKKYITDPIVNLRILNYKVTVQGEVMRPGTFNIISERITLPEAISMAGDMTIYGKRDNVLVIREMDGKKTHNFVDMTQSDFINSPFYYLSQNDLIVVEPNKTRINASAVGPNISVIISSLSLLITVIALLVR
ncbi:polysaccharide export outer membrane protein [Flavobacterium arsenatis]|uniref:Polysaccharide export outer membrane protein n=1 Tax=Flavobacterium arsenatis TaxID=1484332 RepID=A0ABU1TQP9_9FLAO|nr:polysaccharide biosynthesis/export family protein [Flavobacterium arsenatis]MDR6968296.1 polysaccharide export outer membrane protein [Flavobacterium arsenatis]